MWQTIKNAFGDKSIRNKIFFTLAILLVYRIGCYIPVPGLDFAATGFEAEEAAHSVPQVKF